MEKKVILLDTVDEYNRMFGLETLHPLVSVVDLGEATAFPEHFAVNYGIYALFLKQTKCGDIRYGRQIYDYQEGTVTSFAPGQVAEVELTEGVRPKAKGLLFHPDLIKRETGKTAQEYIQNKIIDLSKEMIAGTDFTISQIADHLGFQYSQHFNRLFKKSVGCTPNEYRKAALWQN